MSQSKTRLEVRDLVTIGVFGVIYFVCMFAVGMMGVVPILYLLYPMVFGVVGGPIVLLFMAKVQMPWALVIFGMITPIIMFLFGHTLLVPGVALVTMLVAEGIRRIGKYRSLRYNMLAYVVMATILCSSLLQMLVMKARYLQLTEAEMGREYTEALEKLISVRNMGLVYLGAVLGGIVGAFLGRKLLKKHFEKAGIV
jgi:hypothetical protein